MWVEYNVGVDGWTERPAPKIPMPDKYGYGPIEISEAAWQKLSLNDVIHCRLDLTDTKHLLEVAGKIET